MPYNNFNALHDPAQIGQMVSGAIMAGAQHKALSNYAQNPSMESARGVSGLNPELGIQLQDRETARAAALAKQQEAEQERLIIGAALNGDPNARKQLAYYNSDLYLRLDENQRKSVDQLYDSIAQQAFSILQQPKEQHAALVAQALQGLQAQGIDTSQFRMTGDATQDLYAALAMAGKLETWERFRQPTYEAVSENGLAGFQFGQPIQQNGQVQNFAPPQAELPPGFVIDGGGGVGNGPGGFPR